MATSVVMPALEMAQETGKVVAWRKQEGDAVAKGDVLLEIETDKAVVEVEALAGGILGGVSAAVGDVVPVGHTIAWLLAPGEVPPAVTAPIRTGRRMDTPAAAPAVAAVAAATTAESGARVSPKARRLAKELGVDLSTVRGSGAGGEILAEDVQAAVGGSPSRGAQKPSSAIARLMAERTTESWTTVPHFFVSRAVNATALMAARERLAASIERSHGVKATITDVLVAAAGRALRKHPQMNASWIDGAARQNAHVHVGLAIAVDEGIVAPVIENADTADLATIAGRRQDLAERSRANRLHPSDLAGGTFTISNLGMYHVDAFTAVIVKPQAGILAVGAIADGVVALNGQAVVQPMMTMTLSSDHRVIDGARAAAFLDDLVELLLHPDGWLV